MKRRLLIICITLSVFSACSFVERNTIGLFRHDDASPGFSSTTPVAPSDPDPVSVNVQPKPEAKVETVVPGTRVEVIWEIPKDPVDGYIIRYGFNRDKLEFEEKVSSSSLDRFEDPKFGFVYRHVLKNVPPEKSVFVSLTAYTGTERSAPSPVFEVGKSG